MASPPYTHNLPSAISPPYPAHSQLPQPPKRRSSDMPSSAPSIKRRKGSIISVASTSSAHPLRQTSFPPEMASQSPAYSRSPSADTMSVVGGKKKRPRKSRAKENDTLSLPGGRAKSAVSADGGRGRRRGSRDQSADEEDEEDGAELAVDSAQNTKEERVKEDRRRLLLTRAFDQDQWSRYEAWRSSKLADSTVRRVSPVLTFRIIWVLI